MHDPHYAAYQRNRRRHDREEAERFFALALSAPEGSIKQQQALKLAEYLEYCSQQ